MTGATDQIGDEVATAIAAHAGVLVERVGPDVRLWHDLGLAGDDFAALIEHLHRKHGVTLRGNLRDYCPTEPDLWRHFWWWPFAHTKTYRPLTVGELTVAARSGGHVG